MNILIVEDELHTSKMIEEILYTYFPEFKIQTANNLLQAKEKFFSTSPSVLLLDVNLPDGNSFDFLEEILSEKPNFKIVFITAFAHYAVKAFKFSAVDFLLKPFTPNELKVALNKVLKQFNVELNKKKLETLVYNKNQQAKSKQKITLKTQDDLFLVHLEEIIRAVSDNNYTTFYLHDNRKILVSQPLKYFDELLQDSGFLRVHQSHLINTKVIQSYHKKTNTLVLTNQEEISVSVAKKAQVIKFFNQM
ncbi:LytR/AlgR family response regulator transcription factor [Zhouia sp. PK063]|uniref:LytR/AlgR family response regulator transcription factor n=1 Tax=Zhouia sp. PK063 TaxID=3373602 RepID=UPI0037B81972